MNRFLALAVFGWLFPCSLVFGDDIKAELNRAYGQAVAGDVRPLLSVLESIEDPDQSEYAGLHDKYEKRFVAADERIELEDPFISRLYAHYAAYWRSSLLDPECERASRRILVSKLNALSKEEGRKAGAFEVFTGPNLKTLESFLITLAKKKGYHLLMGRTFPLRELMIWKKEERETYEVELPSESFSVNVVFAQGFLSHGWLGYATFDRSHSGGWNNVGDTIYRAGAKPGENNEYFRVSILAHEGRHVSDRKRYGGLNNWIGEYRAKLTELLLAEKSFGDRLSGFRNEAQDMPSVPHSYASYRLLNDLVEELSKEQAPESFQAFRFEDYSRESLKSAIELILDRSSKSLEATGP